MNKNKIIFAVLGVILLGLIAYLLSNLSSPSNPATGTSGSGEFHIWILNDDTAKFQEYITQFKEMYPSYKNKTVVVESFSNEKTYQNSLSSAIFLGQGPDVFVLNNSETSPLENQILGIDPAKVSPNDFRLRFKPIFGNDLIISDSSDETVEFLKGIPLGYEALGVFYNRKYFLRPSEMRTWTDFAKEITSIANKYSNIVPLALGNGGGVTRAAEVIQALFVAEGANALVTTSDNQARQVLAMYSEFGRTSGNNAYNKLSTDLYSQKDIDLFTQGDVAAMVGYPRDLFTIDKIGYQKSFLFATPFPRFTGNEASVSVDYNYFVINKDTFHRDMALDMMQFMSTQQGQEEFISLYPYYLSPELSVEEEMLEKKIHPNYNIVYKNFVDEDAFLVSYDVGSKDIFDTQLEYILNMESGQEESFSELKTFTICSTTKHSTLLNLSSPCN